MDEPTVCADVRERLPELAAGVLDEAEQDLVLAHLAECPMCRRELDATVAVIDDLLALVPPVQPPDGFADAVLARAAASRPPAALTPPRRRRLVVLQAAAAVVAVLVGVGATLWVTADDRRVAGNYRRTLQVANGRYFTARAFTSPSGPSESRVFAYEGNPSWLLVVVNQPGAAGAYDVHLVTTAGVHRILGQVTLSEGQGVLGVAIDVRWQDIKEVRLLGPAGPPLTAGFR
jgi:hypothetical protein